MRMSTPSPPVRSRAHSRSGRVPAGRTSMRSGSDGLDVVEQGGVAAGAEDPGHAEAERDEASAQAEGSADPVDEDGAAGSGAGLAQCREGGAEVAEAGALFEADAAGQLDQVALGCGEVFGQPAVGVGVEQLLGVGAESEVAHEGVSGAVLVLAAPAGAASAAGQAGVDVDPVADVDVGDHAAHLRDDSGRVQAEDGREPGQRQVGKPFGVGGEHVLQVGYQVAGLDLHEDIGGPWGRYRYLLELHRLADLVQSGGEHGRHGRFSCRWGVRSLGMPASGPLAGD